MIGRVCSAMIPEVVIRPILLPTASVNHSAPSADATRSHLSPVAHLRLRLRAYSAREAVDSAPTPAIAYQRPSP